MDEPQHQTEADNGQSHLTALLCFYVAYQTPVGISWRIVKMPHDLDKAHDLQQWIEAEERSRGVSVVPVFWKRLDA